MSHLWQVYFLVTMAILTKKDLLEAIEDMPMDAPIMSEINDEPMFLTDVYYDSVNKEIHLILC